MTEIRYQRTKSEIFWFLVRQKFLQARFSMPLVLLLLWSIFVLAVARPGPSQVMGALGLAAAVIVPLHTLHLYSRLADKATAQGSLTLSYGDAGLTISGSDAKTEYSWASFSRWSVTDEHVLLYYRERSIPILIPKRAFAPEQLAIFMEHLHRIGKTPSRLKV
jgi:hypothetical protein